MIVSIPTLSAVKVGQSELTSTTTFTYLGSVNSQDGGVSIDIQSRLNKARGVFISMEAVWKSTQYCTPTKNLPELLYLPPFYMDQSAGV